VSYNDEMKPPRVFSVVTSAKVEYNMDFVEHLIKQEIDRRKVAGEPLLSNWETGEFRRKLIGKVILQGDVTAALTLRPQSTRILLKESYDPTN